MARILVADEPALFPEVFGTNMFNLENPNITKLTVCKDFSLVLNSTYHIDHTFTICQKAQDLYVGFISVHQIFLKWVYSLLSPKPEIIILCQIEHSCELNYKYDPHIYHNFLNMLQAAHEWCIRACDLALVDYDLGRISYPDFSFDEKQLMEVTDKLLASDSCKS